MIRVHQLLVGVRRVGGVRNNLQSLLRSLQIDIQRMDEPIGHCYEVVGVIKVHVRHNLRIGVGFCILGVDRQVAADAQRVRLGILIRFTLPNLTAVQAAQFRDRYVAQVGLFVLTVTCTVDDYYSGISDPLDDGYRLHVVYPVIIKETDLVEVGQHRVGAVDPEEEPEMEGFMRNCFLLRISCCD